MQIKELSGRLTLLDGDLFWLVQSDGAWLDSGGDSPPEGWLSSLEMETFTALKTAKRRRDWLLGRRTAKRLIALVLAEGTRAPPPPDEISILSHPDGWPMVSFPRAGEPAPPLTLSISHSGNSAFCAVMAGDGPLGCDIERVEPRTPDFIADYFTPAERELLAGLSSEVHQEYVNAIWSGKEAALKAIRRGLAEDTRLVTCLPQAERARDGWRTLRYLWEKPERNLPPLAGMWWVMDGFVLTLAAGAPLRPGTAA